MFEFTPVSIEDVNSQLHRLHPKKATLSECIPAKILKENSNIIWRILLLCVKQRIIFLANLNMGISLPFSKRMMPYVKRIIGQLLSCQLPVNAIRREVFVVVTLRLQRRL